MSAIQQNGGELGFLKTYTDGTAAVTIKLQSGASSGNNVTLQLPTAMPESTQYLQVATDGVMSYGDGGGGGGGGGGTVSGTYEAAGEGAVGIVSGQDLSAVAGKVDTWIFRNLVDAPPAPTSFAQYDNSSTTIETTFVSPTVYELGALATTVPYISALSASVKRSATSSSLTGTVSISDSSTTVTGSVSAVFLTELNEYSSSTSSSITVGGVTRTVVSIESNTSLTVDAAFTTDASAQVAIRVNYANPESYTLTNVANLPRESSSSVVEAVTVGIEGTVSTGVSGTVDSKTNWNLALAGFSATDYVQIVLTYTNNRSDLFNRAYLSNLTFVQAGVPSAPQSLLTGSGVNSITYSYSAPADNDDNTVGNQSTPPIQYYKTVYSATGLKSGVARYNGAASHSPAALVTASTGPGLSSLYAGHAYTVSVRAKNTVNSTGGLSSDGYGAEATTTFETNAPAAPSLFSARGLTHGHSTVSVSARRVDNVSTISAGNIIRLGAATGTISFTSITGIPVNETATDLEELHHSWAVLVDAVDQSVTSPAHPAFDTPFLYASSTDLTGGDATLNLVNHADAGSGYNAGFYATLDAQLDVANVPAQLAQQSVTLRKVNDGSNTDKTLSFYADDLTTDSSIYAVVLTGSRITDGSASKVSGVPTLRSGFVMHLQVDVQNAARYFLRADKFATVSIEDSSADIAVSSTSFVYGDTNSATAPFLNGAGNAATSLRLTKDLTYTDPGSGRWTPDNVLNFVCTPYSVISTGTAFTPTGINSSHEFGSTGSHDELYIDTVSTRYLAISFPTQVIMTNGYSGGIVDTPAVANAGEHGAYSHSSSLLSGAYQQSLQFVGGRFRTQAHVNAYEDYSGYYDHPSLGAGPDYSGISGTGYRYATFEFDLPGSGTFSKIDITFADTISWTSDAAGFNTFTKLYVKLLDVDGAGDEYTPTTSNFSSVWLDANAVLDTAVARSQANYSDSGKEPLAALENASSGNTTSTVKRVICVAGSPVTNMKVLVRVGLDMAQDYSFGKISIVAS